MPSNTSQTTNSKASYSIDRLEYRHWEQVRQIYQDGIDTGHATFEIEAPDWQSWYNDHLDFGRIVVTNTNDVLGWAALSAVSKRTVYAGVAETSVYVSPGHLGKGIGSVLMESLIDISKENGIWTLQSSVFPENLATVALHEKFGFRPVGIREKIAQQHGVWRDTLIYEKRF